LLEQSFSSTCRPSFFFPPAVPVSLRIRDHLPRRVNTASNGIDARMTFEHPPEAVTIGSQERCGEDLLEWRFVWGQHRNIRPFSSKASAPL
jgi:hypothetical protein